MPTPTNETEARELILDAFESARMSGKQGWRTMTAAVLKNRLLQSTAQTFDEAALGHQRFSDLLESLPDLVELDHTTRPTTVHLVADAPTRPLPASSPNTQIRTDLWHAVVDFASGQRWIWDTEKGVARPEGPGDGDDLEALPTISPDEMDRMRRRFVNAQLPDDGDLGATEVLERWAAEGLGAFALPPTVRHTWNGFMKEQVIQRLRTFFDGSGLPMPSDALQVRARSARSTQADNDLSRLRATVIEVVRSMTLLELSGLPLPAAAVLRSKSPVRRGRH